MGYSENYEAWRKNQTPENLATLLHDFDATINSEIMRYEGSKPLLRSKARTLAVKAIRSYNPMSGAKLQSWVVSNLQPLSRYGKSLRDIHVPEVAAQQAAEVARRRMELSDELGREPSDEELSDEIGISVKRIRDVKKMAMPSVNTGTIDLAQSEDDESSSPAVSFVNKVPFATEAVYMGLNKRDQKIYDWRTGSHGSKVLSVNDVANRLGISSAMVSQRASEIGNQISDVANRDY